MYLWVDSLYIVQDDEDDWSYHAALMYSIYENSFITFSATGASDCNGGMLSPRGPTF